MIIDLKDLIDKDFKKSNRELFFFRVRLKSAIVDYKIENNIMDEEIELILLDENTTKYYSIINALAKNTVHEWDER